MRKGFVDLQVNGYLGVDFTSPTLSPDDVFKISSELASRGVIGYCATLITADMELYARNLPLIARTMDQPGVRGRLLGIHLEGPWLSPDEGAHGAHDPAKMGFPDPDAFERMQEWAQGRISILTLAPELPGALGLIEHVTRRHKTRLSVGHHLASRDVLSKAADAGATLITHLGNGCPNTLPRHENILVYQLANDRLKAGLIGDGHHLPDDFVTIALRCKGLENVFMVSDSAPIAGFEAGIYDTLGNKVRLTAAGQVQHISGRHLVGSGLNLAECMVGLFRRGVLTADQVWQTAFQNPLAILGAASTKVAAHDLPDFDLSGTGIGYGSHH